MSEVSRRLRGVLLASTLAVGVTFAQDVEPLKPAHHDPPAAKADPAPAPAPEDADAKAIVTLVDGSPVPKTWPAGRPLGLSAKTSIAGAKPRSVSWRITPAWLETQSIQADQNRTLWTATGSKPKQIVVRLTVYKSDTGDSIDVPIEVVPNPDDDGPTPEPPPPGPGPTPGPTPTPGPDTPMAKVARDFANGVLEAYAASWETNATVLASGQPVVAALAASDAKLRDLRMAAFRATFYPELNRVIPDNTEVKDQAQRDAIVKLERDFSAALRGLKR